MANKMYPVILEEVSQSLKVSTQDLESDIKDLAEYWETCLEKAHISERDSTIHLLTTCANCYLKGKGIHLGNYALLKKNNAILVGLATLIPLYVWGQPAAQFPKIYELMPMEIYKGQETTPKMDIFAQAEEILRKKTEN